MTKVTKYLVIIFVIILVIGVAYFTFFGKINKMLFNKAEVPTPTSVQSSIEVVSKPKTLIPTPTPDPEADLTALEKDLTDLNKNNTILTKDINSL